MSGMHLLLNTFELIQQRSRWLLYATCLLILTAFNSIHGEGMQVLVMQEIPQSEAWPFFCRCDLCGCLIVESRASGLVLKSDHDIYAAYDSIASIYLWQLEPDTQLVTIYDRFRPRAPVRQLLKYSSERTSTLQYYVKVDSIPDPRDLSSVFLVFPDWNPSNPTIGRLNGRYVSVDFAHDTTQLRLLPGNHHLEIFTSLGEWDSYLNIDQIGSVYVLPVDIHPSDPDRILSQFGSVEFFSEPAGATVVCDNVILGTTPWYCYEMPFGPHRIELLHPDAYPAIAEFDLKSDESGFSIERPILVLDTFHLVGKYGYASIITEPSDADIFIDNVRQTALLPENLRLTAGRHSIHIEAPPDYTPFDTTIEVGFEQHHNIHCSLTYSTGAILIRSYPTNARVFMDEKEYFGMTPISISEIRTGIHEFRLALEEFSDHTFSLEVFKDSIVATTEVLDRKYGYLALRTNPGPAQITIIGPSGKQYSNRDIYTPTPRLRVLAGEYYITAELDDYEPWQDTVWVDHRSIMSRFVQLAHKTGKLEVISIPEGASVTCNGNPVAGKTPLTFDCDTGIQRIRVSKKGQHSYTMRVNIKSGEKLTIRADLSARK